MRQPPFWHCDRGDLWRLFTVVSLFSLLMAANGQPYVRIEADIELVESGPNSSKTSANWHESIVCITSTNEWMIEDETDEGTLNKWCFDGLNVYNSIQRVKPMPEEVRRKFEAVLPKQPPFEVTRSNITIHVWPSPDGHPMAMAAANLTWLAFCSGPYLKREGRLIPLTLEVLRHTSDRFAYTDRTETFADQFGLPRSVDLFLSKALFVKSETDFYRGTPYSANFPELAIKRSNSLTEGAQMLHYEVTQSTNFGGWNLPTRFECSQNPRAFEQNGNWAWRGTGQVKSLQMWKRPEGVFEPHLHQTVVDWRFHDPVSGAEAIMYSSTNASLSLTTDPVLQERFKQRIDTMMRVKERQTNSTTPKSK